MNVKTNIQSRKLILHFAFSVLFLAVVLIAFASKGGGEKRKNVVSSKSEFAPINISSAFTLKNGMSYMGSHTFSQQKEMDHISINTVIAYQNGNNIYILPYKYKVSIAPIINASKNNLQLLDLKIKVHK